MKKTIKLKLDNKEYTATLKDNSTVDDILKMLPLELPLQRFAGHEYYYTLPQKPSINGVPVTSEAHAGGIYYYDRWTAFTVVFRDASIDPYKVIHLGNVNEDITSLVFAENIIEAKFETIL
ncbi:MAG: hypothetical protein LLG13_10960 [Bacteroidales bacterium]|nr:hypothetical protein [Bacteroidales bacterium]